MSEPTTGRWYQANQRYLMAQIARVRGDLERHVARSETADGDPGDDELARELEAAAADLPSPAALENLCSTFGLTDYDRDMLLLCAGMELEGGFGALCARAQGVAERTYPTFGLALAALSDASWASLSPGGPLRRWQLIELGPGQAITSSPMRIDEPILHYLTGIGSPDERLVGLSERVVAEPGALVPSHLQLTEELVETWARTAGTARFPVIQLCGNEISGKAQVASEVCARLQLVLSRLPVAALPTVPAELRKLTRLFNRESLLAAGALLLDCDEVEAGDAIRDVTVRLLLAGYRGPLFLTTRKRRPGYERPVLTVDVSKPVRDEQRQIWHSLVGDESVRAGGELERLVSQFDLSAPTIEAAYARALGQSGAASGGDAAEGDARDLSDALWRSCRTQARPGLDDLAERIERCATWDQLVLPEQQKAVLREIVAHVRQQGKIYETWGFRGRSSRGLGINALFAGASGTGKTMAAEVVARELDLDLYRIDLASVISKYIGETEKNLGRVFDAAEEGGAILLFDEADALFGKRSEIRDSHDRYANVEVSYLLQRMESYRGLAVLTTNMRQALDHAFLRRLRFIVEFPFPDAPERAEIWRRIFPPETPTAGLELDKLARLSVAGGSIRNIALNAAFLAAENGDTVHMGHLLQAARSEFLKVQKAVPEKEVRDWSAES
ncbi:MAG: ATP-binding protein [bacterium]|nr:ATP-binding protein [bacterium]